MNTIKVAIVDCETTGLNEDDEPISIGIVVAEVDDQKGLLVGNVLEWEGEQEPSVPISEGAYKVHGKTVESLKGKKFDLDAINNLLSSVDFLIAHNANFDARMLKKIYKKAAKAKWRCSYRQWVWPGMKNCKLDTVCEYFEIHRPETHRALDDARALFNALSRHSGKTERSMTYLKKLINYYDFDVNYKKVQNQYRDDSLTVTFNLSPYISTARGDESEINALLKGEKRKRVSWGTWFKILIIVAFIGMLVKSCFFF